VRTTVDIDAALIERVKRLAVKERQTLSAIVNEALCAHLGMHKNVTKDPPFELIVRGSKHGKFPSAAMLAQVLEEEDLGALKIPALNRRST
jgi:hypothetical protein